MLSRGKLQINKIPINKKTIAQKFDVSEVTIVKTYKKLLPYKDIILDDELTDTLVKMKQRCKMTKILPSRFIDMHNSTKNKFTYNDIQNKILQVAKTKKASDLGISITNELYNQVKKSVNFSAIKINKHNF